MNLSGLRKSSPDHIEILGRLLVAAGDIAKDTSLGFDDGVRIVINDGKVRGAFLFYFLYSIHVCCVYVCVCVCVFVWIRRTRRPFLYIIIIANMMLYHTGNCIFHHFLLCE